MKDEVYIENHAISQMERRFLTHKRNNIYIALEDVEDWDFFWSKEEIAEFDFWWEKDKPLKEIAEELGRSEMAVLLLSLDRVLKEEVKPRKEWKIW